MSRGEDHMSDKVILVVDIGGSKYMPGFVDLDGNILYQERREWVGVDREAVTKQLIASIHEVCEKQPELAERAVVGGLTIPGFADPENGIWVDSDFLKISDFPICDILEKEFHIPFYADNDGKACALAEKYFGSAKEDENFLYMTVSTGIGGAFYLDGNLYDGAECHAGEVGQPVVEEFGRLSDTGSVRGLVEMYASGRGLAQTYLELSGKMEKQDSVNVGTAIGGKEVVEAAEAGDAAAAEAIDREGRYLGRVIADLCCLTNLQSVVIGGGISLMFDKYEAALHREFQRIHPDKKLRIVPTMLGYTGAFLGAAAVAVRGMAGKNKRSWSGIKEQNVLKLIIGSDLRIELSQDGILLPGAGVAAGRFCTAAHITETGGSVNDAINDICAYMEMHGNDMQGPDDIVNEKMTVLGHAVGKAAAAACVTMDPGKLEIIGWPAECEEFREEFYETLCRETFYRRDFPFAISYCTDYEG